MGEYDYFEPGQKYRFLLKAQVQLCTLNSNQTYVAVGPGILFFDSKDSLSVTGEVLKPKAQHSLLEGVTVTKVPNHGFQKP